MDETIREALKSGTKALENVTDIFNKLAGPLAEVIGIALGDKAREYRLRNAINILRRTKRMVADAGIAPGEIPPRLLVPAIEVASLEDDETLQELWAALLANASDSHRHSNTIMLPSFIDTLKALDQSQAWLLNLVYERLKWREELEPDQGRAVADRDADLWVTSTDGRISLKIGARAKSYFAVELDDLVRLGILSRAGSRNGEIPRGPLSRPNSGVALRVTSVVKLPIGSDQDQQYGYLLTTYGYSFVLACHAPRKVATARNQSGENEAKERGSELGLRD